MAWPGEGTADGVPAVQGLEAIGAVEFKKRLLIGQRLDRHLEPDSGLASLEVQPGHWNAWLQLTPGDEPTIEALVLIRAGQKRVGRCRSERLGAAHRWPLAPQAELQVMDDEAVAEERVLDAVRYLGGTKVYWRRAVTVANDDDWPEEISILSNIDASGALDLVVIQVNSNHAENDNIVNMVDYMTSTLVNAAGVSARTSREKPERISTSGTGSVCVTVGSERQHAVSKLSARVVRQRDDEAIRRRGAEHVVIFLVARLASRGQTPWRR